MWLWVFCTILGLVAMAILPAFIGLTLRILVSVGKKYPRLSDVGATIAFLFMVGCLLLVLYVFTFTFHYLIIGHL